MRNLFIGLLSIFFLLSQNLAASLPISKQVRQLRRGSAVQLHMTDGRILEGKLLSTSGPNLELLEPNHQNPVTINSADVVAVNKISSRPRHRDWVVTALMVGGMLGATGAAVAVAGSIY